MMPIPKWLVAVFVGLALLGFSDASFLTAEHLRGVIPPCTVVSGCEEVLSSRYSTILGIPVAGFGMAYYGTVLVLLLAYIDSQNRRILDLVCWLTLVGFISSLYFMYVQAFVLSAYCLYCLASAGISTLLFAAGMRTLKLK